MPPKTQQQLDDDAEADKKKKLYGSLNPVQQMIAMLLMLFVKNTGDDEQLDKTIGEMTGLGGAAEVRHTRQELNKPDSHDWRESFDFSHTDFKKAGTFVADRVIPPAAPGSGTPSGNPDFDQAVRRVLRREGGLTAEPDGAVANFGINSHAHPEVDVHNLTVDQAKAIYKKDYWDTVKGIDKMSRGQAEVAFDCSVNCGPALANKMVRELTEKHHGDVKEVTTDEMSDWRKNYYKKIVEDNPGRNEKYAKGWNSRVEDVRLEARRMDNDSGLNSTFTTASAGTNNSGTPTTTPPSSPAPGNNRAAAAHV